MDNGADRDARPLGTVVDIASIARAIHLIPDYGAMVHPGLNAMNTLEFCQYFWINCFLDKETHQAVY
jgi:hypothetical protein